MIGHKLAVEQFKTANFHSGYQICERNLRRIGCTRKHAFAKKGASHGKAVKPAHQFVTVPTFDAMRQAPGIQCNECGFDICIDPRVIAVGSNRSACINYLIKARIGGNAKPALAKCFCQ